MQRELSSPQPFLSVKIYSTEIINRSQSRYVAPAPDVLGILKLYNKPVSPLCHYGFTQARKQAVKGRACPGHVARGQGT